MLGFAVYYNEKPVRAYIRCNSGYGKFKPDDNRDTKVKLVLIIPIQFFDLNMFDLLSKSGC